MNFKKHFAKLLPPDKENCKQHLKDDQKKLSHSKSCNLRNPLSTLSDNVPLTRAVVRRRATYKESTKTCVKTTVTKKKVPSRSTSELEKNAQFCFPKEKVTVRNSKEDLENVDNEVFVSGDEHYLSYLPDNIRKDHFHKAIQTQEPKNEVGQTLPVVRVSGGSELARKPARKFTLVKKLSGRYTRYKSEIFYCDCLYNEEYFEDNFKYMLATEGNFVFRKSYLTKYSNFSYRLLIINWLIYLHQVLELSESTLFVTVRMFDHLIATVKISTDIYGLVAVVCLWIANKIHDTRHILAPKLYAVGNGKYSRNEIISTEKDILKSIDFKLSYPEPLSFLYYYLERENLATDLKIRYSAMFFLEMFAFLLEFSSTSPSLLAACALHLVLVKFDVPCENFLKFVDSNLVNENIFKSCSKHLSICVKEILNCKCFTNEVIAKYSVPDKLNVVEFFISD